MQVPCVLGNATAPRIWSQSRFNPFPATAEEDVLPVAVAGASVPIEGSEGIGGLCGYKCVLTYVFMHVQERGQPQGPFLKNHPPCFLSGSLIIGLEHASWLASEP